MDGLTAWDSVDQPRARAAGALWWAPSARLHPARCWASLLQLLMLNGLCYGVHVSGTWTSAAIGNCCETWGRVWRSSVPPTTCELGGAASPPAVRRRLGGTVFVQICCAHALQHCCFRWFPRQHYKEMLSEVAGVEVRPWLLWAGMHCLAGFYVRACGSVSQPTCPLRRHFGSHFKAAYVYLRHRHIGKTT